MSLNCQCALEICRFGMLVFLKSMRGHEFHIQQVQVSDLAIGSG